MTLFCSLELFYRGHTALISFYISIVSYNVPLADIVKTIDLLMENLNLS